VAELTDLGPYRIVEELGRGGMGLVYRAVDERRGRPAAIKVLRPELAGDAEAIEHLRIEARALAAIEHPGVVALYDHGRAAERGPFLALELVEGETLAQRIGARGTLSISDALALARRIAEPLAAVHASGVAHRDLKPDHVFLVPDGEHGRVKLFDFGLAQLGRDPAPPPADGAIFGTPAYMAPEQCVGALGCDHRADLYALGCILFEMITGASPYGFLPARSLLAAHVRGPVPNLAARADVPRAVAQLAASLLAKRPDDRPRGALEVIDRIDELSGPRRHTGAHAALDPAKPRSSTPCA
jgi:eukaryotic-like serine/threonine-protein kinase